MPAMTAPASDDQSGLVHLAALSVLHPNFESKEDMNTIQPGHRATPQYVSLTNNTKARSPHRPYIKFPKSEPEARASDAQPWDVAALCWAYGWPVGLTGGGVIAIVELGGGWISADLEQFCTNNNIPVPSVTDVSVDGTRNRPGVDADSDGEVALDIQVAAAAYSVATGKPAIIRIYWASDIAVGGSCSDPGRLRRMLDLLGIGRGPVGKAGGRVHGTDRGGGGCGGNGRVCCCRGQQFVGWRAECGECRYACELPTRDCLRWHAQDRDIGNRLEQ